MSRNNEFDFHSDVTHDLERRGWHRDDAIALTNRDSVAKEIDRLRTQGKSFREVATRLHAAARKALGAGERKKLDAESARRSPESCPRGPGRGSCYARAGRTKGAVKRLSDSDKGVSCPVCKKRLSEGHEPGDVCSFKCGDILESKWSNPKKARRAGRTGGSNGAMTRAQLTKLIRAGINPVIARRYIVRVSDTHVDGPLAGHGGAVFVTFSMAPPGASEIDALNAPVSFMLAIEASEWSQVTTSSRGPNLAASKVTVRQFKGRTKIRSRSGTPEAIARYVIDTVNTADTLKKPGTGLARGRAKDSNKFETGEWPGLTYWASYLINGDGSGLDANELRAAQAFEASLERDGWSIVGMGKEYIGRYNGQLADLADYQLLRPKKSNRAGRAGGNLGTKRLQIFRDGKWQWIFAWVTNTGKIATTADPRKAIEDVGTNLQYFRGKTHEEVRSISPRDASNAGRAGGMLGKGAPADGVNIGDTLVFTDPHPAYEGRTFRGRVVMRGPHGWVVNTGGRFGNAKVVDDARIVRIIKNKPGSPYYKTSK